MIQNTYTIHSELQKGFQTSWNPLDILTVGILVSRVWELEWTGYRPILVTRSTAKSITNSGKSLAMLNEMFFQQTIHYDDGMWSPGHIASI